MCQWSHLARRGVGVLLRQRHRETRFVSLGNIKRAAKRSTSLLVYNLTLSQNAQSRSRSLVGNLNLETGIPFTQRNHRFGTMTAQNAIYALVSWVYLTHDGTARDYSENPFEGMGNDIACCLCEELSKLTCGKCWARSSYRLSRQRTVFCSRGLKSGWACPESKKTDKLV